jgi:hypothetical protein
LYDDGPIKVLRDAATMFAREARGLLEAHTPPSALAASGDRAPLLRCIAPVAPGQDARATFRLANDGPSPCEASLYVTNFASDGGYDIPAVRVRIAPPRTTIAPKGEATFEIAIAVPVQTPRGAYSGLIQAAGAPYTKAILTVEVT